LYYILPIGSNNTSLAANFRLASYTSALEIPYNWVPICQRNGDDGVFSFQNGITLKVGEAYGAGTSTISTSVPLTSTSAGAPGTIARNANYIYFCVATNTWERVLIDQTTW
jgi:hypothetical protein